jgi:Tol biopolymer transport system component
LPPDALARIGTRRFGGLVHNVRFLGNDILTNGFVRLDAETGLLLDDTGGLATAALSQRGRAERQLFGFQCFAADDLSADGRFAILRCDGERRRFDVTNRRYLDTLPPRKVDGESITNDGAVYYRYLKPGSDGDARSCWGFEHSAFGDAEVCGPDELAVSADGRTRASSSKQGIRVERAGHRDDDAGVLAGGDGLRQFAITPSGDALAVGREDGTVEIWDIARRAVRERFSTAPRSVELLRFSPDGRSLALVERDSRDLLSMWRAGKRLWSEECHHSPDHDSIAFSDDGKKLVFRVWTTLRVVDVETGKGAPDTGSLAGIGWGDEAFTSRQASLTADGSLVVTASMGHVTFWNANDGAVVRDLPAVMPSLVVGPRSHTAYVQDRDRILRTPADPKEQERTILADPQVFLDAVSPDEKTIAAQVGGAPPQAIVLVDVDSGEKHTIALDPSFIEGDIAFSQDGTSLLVVGQRMDSNAVSGQTELLVFDPRTGAPRKALFMKASTQFYRLTDLPGAGIVELGNLGIEWKTGTQVDLRDRETSVATSADHTFSMSRDKGPLSLGDVRKPPPWRHLDWSPPPAHKIVSITGQGRVLACGDGECLVFDVAKHLRD